MVSENSEYRPEQLLIAKLLRDYLKNHYYPAPTVKVEHVLKFIFMVEGIKMSFCKLDISIPSKRIAIRVNGRIHEKKKQKMKDWDQRIVLEFNGWRVIDIDESRYPEFWSPKKYTYLE